MDDDEFTFDDVDQIDLPQVTNPPTQPRQAYPMSLLPRLESGSEEVIFDTAATSADYGPPPAFVDTHIPFRSKSIRQWLVTPFNQMPKTVLPGDSQSGGDGLNAAAAARTMIKSHKDEISVKRWGKKVVELEAENEDTPIASNVVVERVVARPVTTKKSTRSTWTATETDLFYDSLEKLGSDLGLISIFFPGKDRKTISLKFKAECRENPTKVKEALKANKMGQLDLGAFETKIEECRNYRSESVDPLTAEERAMLDELRGDGDGGLQTPTAQPTATPLGGDAVLPLLNGDQQQLDGRSMSDDFAFDDADPMQTPVEFLPPPSAPVAIKVAPKPAPKRMAVKRTRVEAPVNEGQSDAAGIHHRQAFDDFS